MFVMEAMTGKKGDYVSRELTLSGIETILGVKSNG